MGRIPKSNKHKKIKAVDPFYTGERKDALWKIHVVNNAPKNADTQAIPRKARELLEIQKNLKSGISYRQQTYQMSQKAMNQGGKRPVVDAPIIRQGKRESNKKYIKRVQRETTSYVANFRQMEKIGLHPDLPDDMPDKKPKKRPKAEHSESSKDGEIKTATSVSKPKNITDSQKEKTHKKLERLKRKKRQQLEKRSSGFEHLQDTVEFGDIVHRPPQITVRPRKADSSTLQRPGQKNSLLLLEKIKQHKSSAKPGMSLARRVKMEKSRNDAVSAYRELKRQRRTKT